MLKALSLFMGILLIFSCNTSSPADTGKPENPVAPEALEPDNSGLSETGRTVLSVAIDPGTTEFSYETAINLKPVVTYEVLWSDSSVTIESDGNVSWQGDSRDGYLEFAEWKDYSVTAVSVSDPTMSAVLSVTLNDLLDASLWAHNVDGNYSFTTVKFTKDSFGGVSGVYSVAADPVTGEILIALNKINRVGFAGASGNIRGRVMTLDGWDYILQ